MIISQNWRRSIPLVAILASLGILLAAAPAMAPATMPTTSVMHAKTPAVGDKAVDFSLLTLDGKKVELQELLKTGPVVLFELRGWVGYQCPICTQQVGDMITHSKEILATGAHVVLVYPGPADGLKDHAQEFITGKGLPDGYFFVLDPAMNFVSSAGLRWEKTGETAYPATFVIDKTGIVRFAKISDNHAARSTSDEVIKALGALPKP